MELESESGSGATGAKDIDGFGETTDSGNEIGEGVLRSGTGEGEEKKLA